MTSTPFRHQQRIFRPGAAAETIRITLKNSRTKMDRRKHRRHRREPFRELLKDCRTHLVGEFDSAFHGGYEERRTYLNALGVLLNETKSQAIADFDFFEALCKRMLKMLTDDHPCIRAMCYHLLRKSAFNERCLVVMLTTHVDIYVVRAVDLRVENDSERAEALKLISKMIAIYQSSNLKRLIDETSAKAHSGKKYAFPKSIMQPVISIALATVHSPLAKTPKPEAHQRESAEEWDDKMSLPCLGMFFEFCLLEPLLVLDMAGTDWMVRILTGESLMSRRIVTLVSHILASWLNEPKLREKAHLHLVLEQIVAPLIEYGFFQKNSARFVDQLHQRNLDDSGYCGEDVLDNFKYSFLCILRTWAGMFACAAVGPNSTILPSSPLRLLEYLGLGSMGEGNERLQRIRDMIVDICCDFVDLPYAGKKFNTWEEAVKFYQTMHLADNYRSSLKNDFLLAENEARLSYDSTYTQSVDLLASFRALATFVLINAALPQSLARLVLANSDSPSALKATLLLADLLRTAPSILPVGWRESVLSMPTLVQSACESLAQCRAATAIQASEMGTVPPSNAYCYTYLYAENAELVLHRFDQLNHVWIGVVAAQLPEESLLNLFLRSFNASSVKEKRKGKDEARGKRCDSATADGEDDVLDFLENTVPLKASPSISSLLEVATSSTHHHLQQDSVRDVEKFSKEPSHSGSVNWIYAESVLRIVCSAVEEHRKIGASSAMLSLIAKILDALSPMRLDKHPCTNRRHVLVAKMAVQFALAQVSNARDMAADFRSLLAKFASEFCSALELRRDARSPFAVRNLAHTGAMFQFAFIGAFSGHPIGVGILNEFGILQTFVDLMTASTPIEYVKLIVSSLDYGTDGSLMRVILSKAISSTNNDARTWTTRFLGLLASIPSARTWFGNWGIKLLLRQLGDTSVKVVRHAIRLLNTWIPVYAGTINYQLLMRVQWKSLGDAGVLLRSHVFADELTAKVYGERELDEEVDLWMHEFNHRYVMMVDEEMRIVLLALKRAHDGSFSRHSGERLERCHVPTPPHLLASLARHPFGRHVLEGRNVLETLLRPITSMVTNISSSSSDYAAIVAVKSSLLAVGNLASANDEAFAMLPPSCVPKIVKLAEESPTLSVRGVAYWALTLLSQTESGARAIYALGWESNRHQHVIPEFSLVAEVNMKLADERRRRSSPYVPTSLAENERWYFPSRASKGSSMSAAKLPSARTRSFSASDYSSAQRDGLWAAETIRRVSSDVCVYSTTKGRPRLATMSVAKIDEADNDDDGDVDAASAADAEANGLKQRTMTIQTDLLSWLTNTETSSGDADSARQTVNDQHRKPECNVGTVGPRKRRATTATTPIGSLEVLPRNASAMAITRCIRQGLTTTREQLEPEALVADMIRDPHFSCRQRDRYHLAPMRQRTYMQINRNVGDPVRYNFMTKEEWGMTPKELVCQPGKKERHFAEYRKVMMLDDWLWRELRKEDDTAVQAVDAIPVHTFALPAEVDVMCGRIFPSNNNFFAQYDEDNFADHADNCDGESCVSAKHNDNVEDRGAKSGHGRLRLDASQPHAAYRCFYCSGENTRVTSPLLPQADDGADVISLRREVLRQVDMLEIKEAVPERRLLGLRHKHPWLFQWPCLYADVLELLDEYRFKPQSRSFLQLIFYDALKL